MQIRKTNGSRYRNPDTAHGVAVQRELDRQALLAMALDSNFEQELEQARREHRRERAAESERELDWLEGRWD